MHLNIYIPTNLQAVFTFVKYPQIFLMHLFYFQNMYLRKKSTAYIYLPNIPSLRTYTTLQIYVILFPFAFVFEIYAQETNPNAYQTKNDKDEK